MSNNLFSEQRADMVRYQIEARGVKDLRVLHAMRAIPRHNFIPKELWEEAYADHPLPIGDGQTISQPYIVAYMTEALKLRSSEKVLEVGTGSGYQAAVLSDLVKQVHTVERIRSLAQKASENLKLLGINNVEVHLGDGSLGWPDLAPYDAILVTASAPVAPQDLLDQLNLGGRMIIPVGTRFHQELEFWQRDKNGIHSHPIMPVVFVPLLGERGWKQDEW